MERTEAMKKAISMIPYVKEGNHILYRIGKKSFFPLILSDKEFDQVVSKHPRAYIGAYHC